jgi:hypothetical protein
LKGCQIQALEDGQGIGIVSSEGEKGRVIPLRGISLGGVEIPIDFILVARERGKDKNPWTDERRRRRGGGKSNRRRGGGREECRRRREILRRIHNIYIYIYIFVTLAGREKQRQVDNNGMNDQADDANGRALGVDGDRCERSGGESDDGDDYGCLSDWLRFYFEGEFHERSQRRRGR